MDNDIKELTVFEVVGANLRLKNKIENYPGSQVIVGETVTKCKQ